MTPEEAHGLAGRGLAQALKTGHDEAIAGLRPHQAPLAIEPHEAHAGIAPPPLEAWDAAITHAPGPHPGIPPMWAAVVMDSPRVPHVALVPGEFPQRLDVAALLGDPGRWEESPKECHGGLRAWAHGLADANGLLLAAGVLRVAGDADGSIELVMKARKAGCSEADHATLMGALAFDAGKPEIARRYWESLPEGPARWHNLGLAALVTGEPSRGLFTRAAESLDDSDPWHHLAALCAEVSRS